MKTLLLFDVDGTIAESGQIINSVIKEKLIHLNKDKYELGIVGGGTMKKILHQIDSVPFTHIFAECGSSYYRQNKNLSYELVYEHIFRNHELFSYTTILIKTSLEFISNILDCPSGHFVDVRNGLIYISLVGLQASQQQRVKFCQEDVKFSHRRKLLALLMEIVKSNKIEDQLQITLGGGTGIAIYPMEWNKAQVMNHLNVNDYNTIYYFGDKYEKEGNDYPLLYHPKVKGICVDTIKETIENLEKILK